MFYMHNLHVNYCHIRFPHVDVQLWITPLQITLPCGDTELGIVSSK